MYALLIALPDLVVHGAAVSPIPGLGPFFGRAVVDVSITFRFFFFG